MGGGPPPPPPPPGIGGGPPPPPPPPGMGGPPPPPGGGFAPVGPPEKPKKISKGNLKPLNWTKLKNHQIAETFWKDLDDSKFLQRLGPEKDELEQLFSTAPPRILSLSFLFSFIYFSSKKKKLKLSQQMNHKFQVLLL